MKRIWNVMLVVAVVLGMFAWQADALTVRRLSSQEKAATGADLEVVVEYSDFTEDDTNTAETVTLFNVAAKQSVEFVAYVLETAFDTGATQYTSSCAITVGDGTDADFYLTSTEMASDGTEVFLAFGRSPIATTSATVVTGLTETAVTVGTALVPTVVTFTNVVYDSGAVTGNISVTTYALTTSAACTNVAAQTTTALATATDNSLGRKVYTADDTIDAVFTPDANQALDDFTSGKVKLYFRMRDAR